MPLEEELLRTGRWPLCGVDEAGRGPLAGPVVAAAAIITPGSSLRGIVRDSKALSPAKREALYTLLMTSGDCQVGVAMVDEQTIDAINILQASLLAMQQAVAHLSTRPVCVLVDGNRAPDLGCQCIPVIGGDASEPSISAASIVAKVTRDRHMLTLDGLYPGYGFAVHKGYPTRAHYEAIRALGPCPVHRRSYKGVRQLGLF